MTERKKQPFVAIKDITDLTKGKRVIAIGDIHGCFDDFQELLKICQWNHEKDILVLAGDLIDRGPKIKETLHWVRTTPNVFTILSNHEDKLLRYLKGAKVSIGSMKETIEQCGSYLDDGLRDWLESLPCILKFDDNKYLVHAGINPNFPIDKQKKEFCMYARHFNSERNTFADHSAGMWWEHPNRGGEQIFFGHQPMANPIAGPHIALDGGCVFGEELRAWMTGDKIIAVKAKSSYCNLHEYNQFVENPLLVEDELYVKKGLLSKKEKGDLVLYNYTQKCTYDSAWDDVTLKSRGIIYCKKTKEVVSHVMKKFFNLGENEFTQINKLPLHLSYEVYEKVDGSMVTCSKYQNDWIVATRGSFESDQALEAKKIILEEKKYNLNPELSYVFEVIYPANRVSPGARLVVDYGTTRDVVLLTAFNKAQEGIECTRAYLEQHAKALGMPITRRFDMTLDQAVAEQKLIPMNNEGFVIRFADGTRIKLKGDEYIRMQKILNGMSPLSIWEAFTEFGVPHDYLKTLPEEILDEANVIAKKIYDRMDLAFFELKSVMITKLPQVNKNNPEWRKELGLWLKNAELDPIMKKMVFPWVLADNKALFKYIKEKAKPIGNEL